MIGVAFDWNVVVVGAWNPAILTPNGIATRLFGTDGTPVQVLVSVDGLAPPQVVHEGLVVMPSSSKLVVSPVQPAPRPLVKAAEVASKAIDSLRDTPLSAAGVNLRYRFETVPGEIARYLESPIDATLSDAKYHTETTFLRRGLAFEGGTLNLELLQENASGTVLVNFHRDSASASDLVEWLSMAGTMVQTATSLLAETLGLQLRGEEE